MLLNAKTDGDNGSISISSDNIKTGDTTIAAKINDVSPVVSLHERLCRRPQQAKRTPVTLRKESEQRGDALETFKILNNADNLSDFTTISAELVSLSPVSAIYMDTSIKENYGITEASYKALKNLQKLFDERIMPIDTEAFGRIPDTDGFKPVILLLSPLIGKMGINIDGVLRGYFYAGDLFEADKNNAASNETEIIYLAVPDKSRYPTLSGDDIIINLAEKILPQVTAHELQHMINFNERVLIRDKKEEAFWLNEALSHIAEDITGFGGENDLRALSYVFSTYKTSLTSGNDSLSQRGGNYLLLRKLLNSSTISTKEILRLLVTHPATGVKKLEDIFDLPYENMLGNFALSLWLGDYMSEWSIGPEISLSNSPQSKSDRFKSFSIKYPLHITNGELTMPPSSITYLEVNTEKPINITFIPHGNIEPEGYIIVKKRNH